MSDTTPRNPDPPAPPGAPQPPDLDVPVPEPDPEKPPAEEDVRDDAGAVEPPD
jgi:hypothetical protein